MDMRRGYSSGLKGYFKQLCLSWIMISAICVSCQELTSTLREGNHACSGDEVMFTCSVRDPPSVLAWRSTEYIGQDNLLQFTIANMPGTSVRSIINENVVATLTNNTDINGVRVLESQLHIVADQASMVTCTVTNVGTVSIEFSISAVPGVPQRISASEISQLIDNNCIILVAWSPPANSNGSDINQYIVYVPSRNIRNDIFSSTLSTLTVPNCRDGIGIQVAAVNRFGCVGLNSSKVQPSLLDIPTAPTENTMTTEASSASTCTSSQLDVGAVAGIILGAVILVLCLLGILLLIITIYCLKRYAKQGEDTERLIEQDLKEELRENEVKKFVENLLDLYQVLKSQSVAKTNSAVGPLHAMLKKSSVHIIKEAVKSSLDALKWEEHDDVQAAFDKLMEKISSISSIDDMLKSEIKKLKDNAISPKEDELQNALDDLMEKVEKEDPDSIKKILLKLCDTMLEVPKLSPKQEKVVGEFEISLKSLKEIETSLTNEFVKGLEGEGDDVKVKMLNTCVHSMPDGKEEGDFLVINLGGRNLRVLHIKIDNGKREEVLDSKRFSIDKTRKDIFDFIAKSVAEFIKERKITKKLPVGFTFSFPVKQESLISGKLIRLTRGYMATEAVGKDVVQLLKDAFDRRGDIKYDVVALVNNTTATQLAAWKEVPDCSIGLILGDGTNACYMESLDAVPKLKGDRKRYSQVIINTEWGAFGDDGKLENWRTYYDHQLDSMSANPEQQCYEKMISGNYLGEIVRLALKDLMKKGELFEGSPSINFDIFEAFNTRRLSVIEGGDISDCKKWFENRFFIEVSDQDCEVIHRVCEAVSTRAARLAAVGIIALVKKINKIDGCTVAVDGSLYRQYHKFSERIKVALDELAPGNNIMMKLTKYGSSRGAAFAAAMACQLAAARKYKSSRGPAGSVTMEGQQEDTRSDVMEMKKLELSVPKEDEKHTYANLDCDHPVGVGTKVPRT